MRLLLAHESSVDPPGRWRLALAPRDAVLLAWLAIEGPTPRARLARLLWPDASSDAARNALRQRLFQLRRQTGAELVAAGELAALAPGVSHDLADSDRVLGDLAAPLLDTLARAEMPLRREQLRIGLLRCTLAGGRPRGSAAEQWPDAALACDDLALAAEWALWSGLRGTPPWAVEALEAVTRRCEAGAAALLARPLAALTAWRLLQEGRPDRAAPWLEATAADARDLGLTRLHGATPWEALYAARALDAAGRGDEARCAAAIGARWLDDAAGRALPEAFRDSFLHRSAVNRELLAVAARMSR